MVYDINLLPKGKRNESSSRIGLHMMLISILVASVLVVFCFLLPMKTKMALKDQIKEQETKLASSAEVDAEYATALAEVNTLNNMASALEELKANKQNTSTMLNDLEKAIPKNIKLVSIETAGGLITIKGTSETYKEMAQFIVKLRSVKNVNKVTFTDAVVQEKDPTARNKEKKIFDFTVYLNCNYTDVLATMQNAAATPAAPAVAPAQETQEGGNNEAN